MHLNSSSLSLCRTLVCLLVFATTACNPENGSEGTNCETEPTGSGESPCTCDPGYSSNGSKCFDIDECADGTHNCDANATCTNTPGSFTCACAPGYTGDGLKCSDIDECADGTHNCDANTICKNTPGSFVCECNFLQLGGDSCPCPADFLDCDGDASNGCEAHAPTDPMNCGACGVSVDDGNSCTADSCSNGFPVHINSSLGTVCGSGLECNGNGACLIAQGYPCNADGDCVGGICMSNFCVGSLCSSGSDCPSHICEDEMCLPAQPQNGPLEWITVVLAKNDDPGNLGYTFDVSHMVTRDDGMTALLGNAEGYMVTFGPIYVGVFSDSWPHFHASFGSNGAMTGGGHYSLPSELNGHRNISIFPAGGNLGRTDYQTSGNFVCSTDFETASLSKSLPIVPVQAIGGVNGHLSLTAYECPTQVFIDYGDGMTSFGTRMVTYSPTGTVLMNKARLELPSSPFFLGSAGELYFMSGTDLIKYGPQGTLQWSKSFATVWNRHWDIDSAGNLLFAFNFAGTVDLGIGAITSSGASDIGLAKLDPNGNVIWQNHVGGAGFTPSVLAMKRAGTSEFALQVAISGTADFGDGPWAGPSVLAKFDASGNFLWHVDFAGSAEFMDADAAGAVLLGSDGQTLDFGWGPPLASQKGFILAKFGP